jgi:hypothetical protein
MIKYLYINILFFICVSIYAQPANNNCTSPQVLTDLDNGCVTISNTGATYDSYVLGCFGGDNNNVWYSFTTQGPTATISANIPVNNSSPSIGVSYSPNGDPCTLADAVGVACFTQNGNYQFLEGTVNNLVVGETYYIQVVSNNTGNLTLCINNPVAAPVELCDDISPFCSDSPITFPAETNTTSPSGPAYGCLGSQPNPAWFYLEIDNPGNIQITLTSNPLRDIDFIIWGPFNSINSGCQGGITLPGNIEDCSFSAATTEIVDITNAQTGEIYILMITNFSNQPTNITAVQTGGTGTTDCSIILPIELLSFSVERRDGFNLIRWSTASEINNDYFTLERSNDGENWKIINVQSGQINSTKTHFYSYMDTDYSESINYYRLSQTDFDGSKEYFNVITINNEGKAIKSIEYYDLIGVKQFNLELNVIYIKRITYIDNTVFQSKIIVNN